jgi:hypothetical protein
MLPNNSSIHRKCHENLKFPSVKSLPSDRKTRIPQPVQRLTAGWMVWGSNLSGDERFSLLHTLLDQH